MRAALFLLSLAIIEPALGETPSASASTAALPEVSAPVLRLALGPALFIAGGRGRLGAALSALFRVSSVMALDLGVDAAYTTETDGPADRLHTVVPTVVAQITFVDHAEVRPYLALGAGVMLDYHDKYRRSQVAVSLKPGVDVPIGRTLGLNVEPGIAVYGAQPVFHPRTSLLIRL